MQALIIYSTTDGQTKKIAEQLQNKIALNCTLININDVQKYQVKDFDLIVIGASIRYGHFAKAVYQFIEKEYEYLNQIESAFFSVNLTARKVDKNSPETNAYTRKFLSNVKWKPQIVRVFAGALRYPQYGFFDKFMIKLIMKITGGETDTTKEIDYTDWESVDRFANDLQNRYAKRNLKM